MPHRFTTHGRTVQGHSTPRKHLDPERWFRKFDYSGTTTIKIDIAPQRDEDVNSLAARLNEMAGSVKGRLAIDLSSVEEYTTSWIRALTDLADACMAMGGRLEMEGLCPTGHRLFNETRRLQLRPVGRVRQVEQRPRPFSVYANAA
jgi:hypothetical protein